MIRKKDVEVANVKVGGKFDGYTETWNAARFSIKSIRALMKLTEKFEKNL